MSNLTPGSLIIVNVSLDADATPPVAVDPPVIDVKGPATIVWQIASKSRFQDFRFVQGSLHFSNGVGLISKSEESSRCSVYYTNAIKDRDDIPYTLLVEHQGRYYSTGSVRQFQAPCIRNK